MTEETYSGSHYILLSWSRSWFQTVLLKADMPFYSAIAVFVTPSHSLVITAD